MKRLGIAAAGLAVAATLAFGAGAFALLVWPGRGAGDEPRFKEHIVISFVRASPILGLAGQTGADREQSWEESCTGWEVGDSVIEGILNSAKERERYARPARREEPDAEEGIGQGADWRARYVGGGLWLVETGCLYPLTIEGQQYNVLQPFELVWFDERSGNVFPP
jgi:hypothetical protein